MIMIKGQIEYSSVWVGHFGLTGSSYALSGPFLNLREDFLLSVLIHFLHINMSESKSFSVDLTTKYEHLFSPRGGAMPHLHLLSFYSGGKVRKATSDT